MDDNAQLMVDELQLTKRVNDTLSEKDKDFVDSLFRRPHVALSEHQALKVLRLYVKHVRQLSVCDVNLAKTDSALRPVFAVARD